MEDSINANSGGVMTHKFHKSWLKVTAVVVGSFGPIFFLGTMASTLEPARLTLDIISWPMDGNITYDSTDVRLLSALCGGFLMGWGVTIWLLSRWVYDLAPEAVRKVVLFGILAWYIFDSIGSAASGNPFNVLFNTIVLLVAVGPMWKKAK